MAGSIELRDSVELRAAAGRLLTGWASVWDSPAQLPGFEERVERGAFADSLRTNPDVLLLHNHDGGQVIARTRNGSLRLREDDRGLHFTADAPRTTLGDDVLEAVRSGLLANVSIGFRVPPGGDRWDGPGRRTLQRVDLVEISTVAAPAYPATSISARFRSASVDTARLRGLFLAGL